MYTKFFGLRCAPFEDRADPHFFFATPNREETLAAMEYEAGYGSGMVLLLGAAGMGKTQLIRMLTLRLPQSDHVVVLAWQAQTEHNLLREACKGFGVTIPSSSTHARCLVRLRRHLARTRRAEHRSILIIDQAHNLTFENLTQVASLMDLQDERGKLLKIILTGQPRFKTLLDRPEFDGLRQQLYGERSLEPFTVEQISAYVSHRLRVAGATGSVGFDEGTAEAIHAVTEGVPRLINHVCNAAMTAAYGAGVRQVSCEILRDVTQTRATETRTAAVKDLGVRSVDELAAGQVIGARSSRTGSFQQDPASPGADALSRAGMPGSAEPPAGSDSTSFPADFRNPEGRHGGPADAGPATMVGPTPSATAVAVEMTAGAVDRAAGSMKAVSPPTRQVSGRSMEPAQEIDVVETRVNAISQSGRRLVQSIGQSVDHASEAIQSLEDKVERMIASAERRVSVLESSAAHAVAVAADTVGDTTRIERACERADRMEERLTSFGEQLADKADEVRSQVAALMGSVETGERVREQLDSLVAGASADLTRETLNRVRAEVESSIRSTANDLIGEFSAQLVGSIESKLDEAKRAIESQMALFSDRESQLRGALEDSSKQQERTIETARKATRQIVEDTRQGAEQVVQECQQEMTQFAKAFHETMDRVSGKAGEVAAERIDAKMAEIVAEAQSDLNQAATRQGVLVAKLTASVQSTNKQIDAKLAEAARHCDELTGSVKSTLNEATEQQAELDGRLTASIQSANEQIDAKLAEAARHCDELTGSVTSSMNEATAKQAELDGRLTASIQSANEQIDAKLAEAAWHCDELTGSVKSSLNEATEQQAELDGRLTASIQSANEQIEAKVAEAARQCDELTGSVTSSMNEATTQQAELDQGLTAAIQAGNGQIDAKVAEAARQCDELTGSVKVSLNEARTQQAEWDQRLTAALQAANGQVDAKITDAAAQCEALVGEVKSSLGEAAAQRADLDGKLEATIQQGIRRVGQLTQRIDELSERRDELAGSVASLETTVGEATAVVDCLSDRAGESRASLIDALSQGEQLMQDVRHEHGRIEAVHQTVAQALVEIGGVQERFEAVEQRASQCEQIASRIDTLMADGSLIRDSLAGSVDSARKVLDGLERVVSDADGRINRLDSHNASATSVLHKLSEVNVDGHQTVENCNSAIQGAKDAVAGVTEKVDRMLSEVWGLTGKSEIATDALTKSCTRAEKLVAVFDRAAEPARQLAGELSKRIEKARVQVRDLEKHGAVTGQLLEQMPAITSAMATAKNAQAEADRSAQAAREVCAELASTAANVKEELNEMRARLAEFMENARETVEPGERLMREFAKQADTFARELQALRQRSASIEEQVQQAMDAPNRTLIEAQAQATRLERVCGSVRKVFAELSQASLDANKQAKTCRQVSEEANTRLTTLAGENDRAIGTLSEWVEEATRVQSRLERLVGQAPSLSDTHPGESVRSGILKTGTMSMMAESGVTHTSIARAGVMPSQKQNSASGAADRADEIAAMIRDAKQVAAKGTNDLRTVTPN